MNKVRARVRVRGEVQGVGYRASARWVADSLGLTGWVRNCPDGSVEAVFDGDSPAVDEAIEWCRRGPSFAEVESVEVEWLPHGDEFTRFAIV